MSNKSPNLANTEPYRQAVDDVLATLGTHPRSGLSQCEAQQRLGRCSRNELTTEPPVPEWRKFLAQFADGLVILLIIAGAVSAGLWLYERDAALPYEAMASERGHRSAGESACSFIPASSPPNLRCGPLRAQAALSSGIVFPLP